MGLNVFTPSPDRNSSPDAMYPCCYAQILPCSPRRLSTSDIANAGMYEGNFEENLLIEQIK